MSKLIVTVEKNTEIAQKVLKKWQFMVYKRKLNALLGIIYSALKKYDHKSDGNTKTFMEEGSKEYIELQARRFESFMFSDESELRKDKYKQFNSAMSDRWIQRVNNTAHKWKDRIKDKAIRASLGGGDVLSFFTKVGIFIKWEVEK